MRMAQPRYARPAAPRRPAMGPVLRYGGMLGLIYGALAIIGRIGGDSATVDGFIRVLSAIAGVGFLIAVGVAVARQGARVRQAAIAGLLAGGVAWLIDTVVVIVLYRLSPGYYLNQALQNARLSAQQTSQLLGQTYTPTSLTAADVVGALVIGLIADLAFSLAFGALFGALGWVLIQARSASAMWPRRSVR